MTETPQTGWTALVGHQDEPTDALRDYCEFLAEALGRQGIPMKLARMRWAERGWIRGLRELWRAAGDWKDRWVLVQYTALSWSRRGFPFGAVAVMAALALRGARVAVVFHDWSAYPGSRVVDRVRRACQFWTMRRVVSLARRSVFPVLPERVHWLRAAANRAVFIPIGANLPTPKITAPAGDCAEHEGQASSGRTVGVYGVTGGQPGAGEITAIAAAMRKVASRVPGVRLVVIGRGSRESRSAFERSLDGAGIDLSILGLLPAEDVARELCRADALLFVRGEILGHRGSVIAGIACGVPVVGYGDPERAFPLSTAGIVLVPPGDNDSLAAALERVLVDETLRLDLRERNRRAQAEYFSWDRIAGRFVEALAND